MCTASVIYIYNKTKIKRYVCSKHFIHTTLNKWNLKIKKKIVFHFILFLAVLAVLKCPKDSSISLRDEAIDTHRLIPRKIYAKKKTIRKLL